MADEPLPKALRRQVARFTQEYLPTLVVEAMTREGLLDPVAHPDRVEMAKTFLGEVAAIAGGMQKGPFARYVIQADGEALNEWVGDGNPAVTEVSFASEAELRAFNSGLEDFDGWVNVESYDQRRAAEARAKELLAPYAEKDEFGPMTEEQVVARMGWNADTMNLLRKRYIDEDRHAEGPFVDWIRALAREEAESETGG